MGRVKLTIRDLEILRTLMRVHLARTRSLQWVFFPNMGVARRRLRALRDYGLITTHARGLPGPLSAGGHYWRLTPHGLDVVIQTFRDEYEPENLITRTKRASLRYFEHRDEVTDTYMRLIYTQDQYCDEIVVRADGLQWRGEYEVQLSFTEMGSDPKARIIPDATLITEERRIFIEIDRSTESHARCKRTIDRYASSITYGHYRKLFGDDLPCSVVYITQSERRAKGLQKLMDDRFSKLPYEGLAMITREATGWLRDKTSSLPEREPDVREEELKVAYGTLRNLYDASRSLAADSMGSGALTAPPKELIEAYEVLQRREAYEHE